MDMQELVETWFEKWETGDYLDIPVAEDFKHTSPYGTIEGKETYLNLVEANKDKFLGNHIEINDAVYRENCACVRYTITQDDFTMEVSEWLYKGTNNMIAEIVSYYNIKGDISEDRKLSDLS